MLQDKDRIKQGQNTDSANKENILKQSKAIKNWIINKGHFKNKSPTQQNKSLNTDLVSAPSVFSDDGDDVPSRNKNRLLMAPKLSNNQI